MSLRDDLKKLAATNPELRAELLPLLRKTAITADERVAEWSQKHRQLTYWTSKNTSTSVSCDTEAKAKAIIRKSGVEQKFKKVAAGSRTARRSTIREFVSDLSEGDGITPEEVAEVVGLAPGIVFMSMVGFERKYDLWEHRRMDHGYDVFQMNDPENNSDLAKVKKFLEALERQGQKKRASRSAASSDMGLKLRGQIRHMERTMGGVEAELPSEDSIMDDPTEYNAKMKAALKKLTKIKQDIEAYNNTTFH